MIRGQRNQREMASHPVSIGSSGTTRLLTNSYRLQTLSTIEVLMYDIQVEPSIESDNMMLKKRLVKSLRRDIERSLGRFIHAGGSLFVLRGPQEEVNSLQLITTVSGVDYT